MGGTQCVGGGTCRRAGAGGAAETRPWSPAGRSGYRLPPSLRELPVGPTGHVTEGGSGNRRGGPQIPALGERSLPETQRVLPEFWGDSILLRLPTDPHHEA